jgi:hypothetical protein
MRDIETQFPVYTDDLDSSLLLVVDTQEIAYILGDIGADFDAGSLLVDAQDGEYTQVWGALTSVPRTETRWFDLLD